MYLPVHDEHDQAGVDLGGAFKPLSISLDPNPNPNPGLIILTLA